MTVVLFIVILGVLVFVHELGHFIAAKRSGIRVDEFALGFPPKIFSKKVGETNYALNLIPFGGYVKIFGENPDDESLHGPDRARSFVGKNRAIQAVVLTAGVLGNIIFAWVLISVGFMYGFPVPADEYPQYSLTDSHIIIADAVKDSPAAKAGLRPGDRIRSLSALGNTIENPYGNDIEAFITDAGAVPIEFSYQRGADIHTVSITPVEGLVEGRPAIGVGLAPVGLLRLPVHLSFIEGAKTTSILLTAIAGGLAAFLADAFRGVADFSSVAGPVGIAGMVSDAQSLGIVYLLSFTAMISLNLAVINLLPFPALDGGRLLFVVIESIIRRRISPAVQNAANRIGFVLLLTLMIVVTWKDIARLF